MCFLCCILMFLWVNHVFNCLMIFLCFLLNILVMLLCVSSCSWNVRDACLHFLMIFLCAPMILYDFVARLRYGCPVSYVCSECSYECLYVCLYVLMLVTSVSNVFSQCYYDIIMCVLVSLWFSFVIIMCVLYVLMMVLCLS